MGLRSPWFRPRPTLIFKNVSFHLKKKQKQSSSRVRTETRSRRNRLRSSFCHHSINKAIDTGQVGDLSRLLENKTVKKTSTHLSDLLDQHLRKVKMGNTTLWTMTNTTFPVFLMDNIRLRSHGKETSVLRLHKETDCLRTGYLNVLLFPSFFFFFFLVLFELSSTSRIHRTCYLRQWLISIRTCGQGALL